MRALVIWSFLSGLVAFTSNLSSASQTNSSLMGQITENIKNVCQAPSERGKYWEVKVKGSGDAKVKLKLANAGVSGEAAFTKGEWEGVQRVLQEQQVQENANYRDCAKKLTPLFLDKFGPNPRTLDINKVVFHKVVAGLANDYERDLVEQRRQIAEQRERYEKEIERYEKEIENKSEEIKKLTEALANLSKAAEQRERYRERIENVTNELATLSKAPDKVTEKTDIELKALLNTSRYLPAHEKALILSSREITSLLKKNWEFYIELSEQIKQTQEISLPNDAKISLSNNAI